MKAKKSLGQHWLKDERYLEAVCDAGLVHEHDTVLEVGPGLGTLTDKLIAKGAKVIAVEKDENLASDLQHKYRDRGNYVRIVSGDILNFDLSKLPANYKVVANIPYYLTSNLIRALSEAQNPPKVIALLVQREVAERIAAKPGEMSLLSVSAQTYYQPHLEEVVPAKFFTPPPKVDSQIVQLLRRSSPLVDELELPKFFRVVKAGFSSRRKTLENSLSGGLRVDKQKLRQLLNNVAINPSSRPQELTLEQWVKLANEL